MLREKTLAKPSTNRTRRRELRPAPADWTQSSLGERVDHICRLRGWSQNRLGQESGYASGVISRLADREAAIAGAPQTLARVAKAAGVNVLWLMLGEGPVEPLAPPVGSLRAHPDWPTALAEAKKWQRGIPEEFWELPGDAVFPTLARLDSQLVVGLVREFYSAYLRWEGKRGGEGGSVA
jgi:transcriptional regulator with XRE-family HTH domain